MVEIDMHAEQPAAVVKFKSSICFYRSFSNYIWQKKMFR